MRIREIECKSIISDSGIYGADYSINPYTGCEHGCKYCYATFMREYTGHREPWGGFVDVKINSREVLEKDLTRKKRGSIILSSVTDPYQPIERRYMLTREILRRLADTDFSISILTKSDLILRDLDVFRSFRPERICVGFTINFLEEADRKIWEPNSSKISERIGALKEISKIGIDCYVHVGPYFEGITNLEKILEETNEHITELQVENINWRRAEGRIMETIRGNYPRLERKYNDIRENPNQYNRALKGKIKKLGKPNFPMELFLG